MVDERVAGGLMMGTVARLVVVVCTLCVCQQALAAKRVALVIGISAYQHAPALANPKNDAEAIAAALERLDFEVMKGIDLTRAEFEQMVRQYSRTIRGADVALFFYAGHGLQVSGHNYLAPVDAELLDQADLEFETLRLETIIAQMEREQRTNLVFLDACRDNPLARSLAGSLGTRSASVGRGLAPIETGIGTLIAFATQPGNVALDGQTTNSPFTEALVEHIETPGVDIAVLLRKVRQQVIASTGGRQVPWSNSSLTGEVILKPKPQQSPSATAPQDRTLEIAYWNSIEDQTDPAYFEAYLQEYPNGVFTRIARLRIDQLENLDKEQQTSSQPDTIQPMSRREMVRGVQQQLNRLGCSVGPADGQWGKNSTRGLRAFNENGGWHLSSLEPSENLLDLLKGLNSPACSEPAKADANSYAGFWQFTRTASNPSSCGWSSLTTTLIVKDGKISGGPYLGIVSDNGSVRLTQTFIHNGRTERNLYQGKLDDAKGGGSFQHIGGGCRGRFSMSKL